MKQLSAIIRKEKLEAVKEAVQTYDSIGMTVYEISGCGSHRENDDAEGLVFSENMKRNVIFTSKMRIDVVVNDKDVENLIDIICNAAGTGNCGDGKIFVTNVEQAVRIRNREQDEEAI